MPMPGPSSSHRRRSRGKPSARRGYQESGTDTTRPSRNSTTSARSVTRTFLAAAVSGATLEVVMPCLREFGFVLSNNPADSIQFRFAESIVVRHSHWPKPELGQLTVSLYMDVNGLVSVAGEEEKPVWPAVMRPAPLHSLHTSSARTGLPSTA